MNRNLRPDATESNAGDDFHILWTIRKSLALLNFESEGLKLITVEELSPSDIKKLPKDPDGDILLGVDLTEYYGGKDISSAKRVIVSQLKYSTRRTSLPWTAAKICQGKKDTSGSTIHRLGTLFKGLYTPAKRKSLLKKLQIKLVSNRPAAVTLLNAISAAQSILKADVTYAAFKKGLQPKAASDIDRLKKASLLKGEAFLDFLRVLDFSDCNSDSRAELKQNLIKAIGELGSDETRKEYSQLKDLVWSKMQPEAKGKTSLVLTDLVFQFGMPDLTSLFPARSNFEQQKSTIAREQLPEIIREIMHPDHGITALHAGAGIGKSTIVQQLVSKLPTGSAAVLFDCYGGGTYLDPEDKRHKHENAFMQLSNELALTAGSPFLIKRQDNEDLYIKAFKGRLVEACELIQKVNSDAVVAVFIDAADNSVTASEEYKQRCFVHDLVRMNLPERCKLIVTARTERLSSLELPDEGVKKILLKPFSSKETALFLTQSGFPASAGEVEQFRELTYATPRVMSYVLGLDGATLQQKLKPLRPKGKSLADIFKLQINLASKRSGNKKGVAQLLTNLILLPRPVPLQYLVQTTGLTKAMIDDMSAELWSGLVRQGNLFSFRDEDFETYLRNTYTAGHKEWNAIAETFLARADNDEYASTHLASGLAHAGRKEELLDIVLQQRFLKFPEDPVKNKEVSVERTRQAMLHCTHADRLNLLKLQMIAAEAAKANDVLEKILLDNPELASSYGNIQTNQKIYFQEGNPGWFGRVHFRSAAIYSRNKSAHGLAKDHFQKAREWTGYRSKLKDKALDKFPITNRDIAYGAEAVLHLEGVDQCIYWLNGWRPKEAIFRAVRLLVETLLETTDTRQLVKWIKGRTFRVDIQILIASIFAKYGLSFPLPIDPILTRLRRFKGKIEPPLDSMLMSFCEYILGTGKAYADVKPILDLISISVPEHALRFYGQSNEFRELDLLFRKSVIEAIYEKKVLTLSDFYPEKLKQAIAKKANRHSGIGDDETRRFNGLYKHMISIYEIRARFLTKQSTASNRKKILSEVLQTLEKDWEFAHRHEHDLRHLYKHLSVKLLDIAFVTSDDTLITKIRDSFLIKNRDNIVLHQAVADRVSHTQKFEVQVLAILADADKAIERATISGSEKVDYYKEAAIIASRVSGQAGKYYFDLMVEASSEVDLEAHHQIRCITHIADDNSIFHEPKLAHDFARYVEYCSTMLSGWDHFPWEPGVEGIAKLDMATAFAVLCRWDHRGTRDSQQHLIQLLKLSLEQGYLDHITAGSLLPLNPYYSSYLYGLMALILQKFDAVGNHTLKTQFVKAVIMDIKLHASSDFAKKFLDAIRDKKYLDGALVDAFEEYLEQLEEVNAATVPSSPALSKGTVIKSHKGTKDNTRKSYAASMRRTDVTSSKQIHELLMLLRSKAKGYLNEDLAFEMLEQKVKPSQRVAYLDAICNLPEKVMSSWTYEKVLEDLLQKWGGFPDVKAWKQRTWPQDLKNRFSYFTNHDYFSSDSVSKLSGLYDASKEDVASLVLSILPDHIGELSASVIYQLFQCTAQGLNRTERQELLSWTIARWSKRVKPDFGDGEYHAALALPSDPAAVISQVVRYHIGHPDKRIRWRTGHCLRRFVDLGNTDIIFRLIEAQNQRICVLFQHVTYPFYWMSAKLYLWISIERICKEHPKAMTRFKDQFLTTLFDNDPPHAQIRYFIKSICLSLAEFHPDLFSPEEKNKVNTCLVGQKPKRKASRPLRGSSKGASTSFQFKFDSLDTIPYWYDPLGRLFDLSGNQIAHIAEKFIRTHWGFTGDPIQENHVKDQDYSLRSNSHGAEPTVEDLQNYYEYHAMFCVADELLEGHPLIDADDAYEDWDQWLASWALCWQDFWLADLRDPIPLVRKFHNSEREINNWQWSVSLNDFHQAIGLKDAVDKTYLTIYESSSVYYYEDHESTFIASALVAPEYARSLLLALQTSDHSYECHVPFQDEEKDAWEDEEDSEENDVFQMTGWIRNVKDQDEGLDDRDELYSGIQKERIVIGNEFIKWSKAKISPDMRYSYIETDPDVAVTHLEVWNDIPPKLSYNSHSSSGSRLRIQKKDLLQFLKASNRCLMLKCRISRYRKDDDFDYKLNRDYTLIYLFYPNGTIETIAGNHRLR